MFDSAFKIFFIDYYELHSFAFAYYLTVLLLHLPNKLWEQTLQWSSTKSLLRLEYAYTMVVVHHLLPFCTM